MPRAGAVARGRGAGRGVVTASERLVVVGAGLAGASCIQSVRELGYAGEITLLGNEGRLPYDRPPLSKEVLRGDRDPGARELHPRAWYAERGVELRLDAVAAGIDVERRAVALVDGERIEFGDLVVATGAAPKALPGAKAEKYVHYLRTAEDAEGLRAALTRSDSVLVVGAGLIGSEVAATSRLLGLEVTLIEAGPHPWAEAVDARIGGILARLHADHGTRLLIDSAVNGIEPNGSGAKVGLVSGETLKASVVVVGIGVRSCTDWLAGSGLGVDRGLSCDGTLRAAPAVWGAGDVASWEETRTASRVRVEHWMTARAHGRHVGGNIMRAREGPGVPLEAFENVPYFWSQQYGHLIQQVGWPTADIEEVEDDGDSVARFLVYRSGDHVVGAFAIDSGGPCMLAMRAIEAGKSLDWLRRKLRARGERSA